MLGRYRESLKGDRRHLFDSFGFVDMARKVVGVGSVGTRAWVVLMMGRDGQDPLFLQAKEAEASVLEPYVGASEFGNHGERVVEGQWLMQASSDVLLGWLPGPESTATIATSTCASSGTASAVRSVCEAGTAVSARAIGDQDRMAYLAAEPIRRSPTLRRRGPNELGRREWADRGRDRPRLNPGCKVASRQGA